MTVMTLHSCDTDNDDNDDKITRYEELTQKIKKNKNLYNIVFLLKIRHILNNFRFACPIFGSTFVFVAEVAEVPNNWRCGDEHVF